MDKTCRSDTVQGRRDAARAEDTGPTQDTQEQVVIEETLLEAEEKMEKAVVVAKEDFAAIRTGRAHPAMFNKIVADYYGALTPINQLASFSVPEAAHGRGDPVRQERAAQHRAGDPRLGPRRQPEQRRQHHPGGVPRAHRGAPQGVHQGRQDQGRGRQDLDPHRPPQGQGDASTSSIKDGEVGEDEGRRAEKELDDTTAKYVAQVDELLKHKEAELLEV